MYPVYTMQVISQNIDGGATEADGGASAPVGPSVATPLFLSLLRTVCYSLGHILQDFLTLGLLSRCFMRIRSRKLGKRVFKEFFYLITSF